MFEYTYNQSRVGRKVTTRLCNFVYRGVLQADENSARRRKDVYVHGDMKDLHPAPHLPC